MIYRKTLIIVHHTKPNTNKPAGCLTAVEQ